MIIGYTVPEIWHVADVIILHRCTKNYDYMMYGFWDMVQTDIQVGAPPKNSCLINIQLST